jgi:hypothetical protein
MSRPFTWECPLYLKCIVRPGVLAPIYRPILLSIVEPDEDEASSISPYQCDTCCMNDCCQTPKTKNGTRSTAHSQEATRRGLRRSDRFSNLNDLDNFPRKVKHNNDAGSWIASAMGAKTQSKMDTVALIKRNARAPRPFRPVVRGVGVSPVEVVEDTSAFWIFASLALQ